MVARKGEIWWANLPSPTGSGPGFRRPVVVVQANDFNASAIATVIVAVITSNLALAEAPGNVRLPRRQSKLSRTSVVNVSQILTVDKSLLTERVCPPSATLMQNLDSGLRLVLDL